MNRIPAVNCGQKRLTAFCISRLSNAFSGIIGIVAPARILWASDTLKLFKKRCFDPNIWIKNPRIFPAADLECAAYLTKTQKVSWAVLRPILYSPLPPPLILLTIIYILIIKEHVFRLFKTASFYFGFVYFLIFVSFLRKWKPVCERMTLYFLHPVISHFNVTLFV